MSNKLYIIGAGEFGREVAAMLPFSNQKSHFSQTVFIDDAYPPSEVVNGIPVMGGIDWLCKNEPQAAVFIALGDTALRRKVIAKLQTHAFSYPSIIHDTVRMHSTFFNKVSEKGVYISQGVIITTNTLIGAFSVIHPNCVLHHDTHLGINTTLMTGTIISAGAHFGQDSFVGSGSVIATKKEFPANTILPPGTVE